MDKNEKGSKVGGSTIPIPFSIGSGLSYPDDEWGNFKQPHKGIGVIGRI